MQKNASGASGLSPFCASEETKTFEHHLATSSNYPFDKWGIFVARKHVVWEEGSAPNPSATHSRHIWQQFRSVFVGFWVHACSAVALPTTSAQLKGQTDENIGVLQQPTKIAKTCQNKQKPLSRKKDARLEAIWSLWSQLSEQVRHIRVLRLHVHNTMVQVGRKAVRSAAAATDVAVPVPKTPRLTQADLTPTAFGTLRAEELPDSFRFDNCQQVLDWIGALDIPGHERRLISWFQINVAFEHDLRTKGVQFVAKRRQWMTAGPRCQDDFAKRTNRLSRYIRAIAEVGGGVCKASHLRPDSGVIQFWTQCIYVRWPFACWQRAEILLRDQQARLNSVREVRGLVWCFSILRARYASAVAEASNTQKSGEKCSFFKNVYQNNDCTSFCVPNEGPSII